MHKHFLISSILTIVVSAVVAQAALAGGESKNQVPFTRQITAIPYDPSDVVSRYLARQQGSATQGEAKSELPFTRQVTAAASDPSDVVSRYLARQQGSATQGEAKNELPFVRQVSESATASSSRGGLDWALAIGVVAAVLAIGAGVGLPRHRVPRTT
ncbi:MAG TPA: hypothetical protein VGI77_14095 [Gaiellaceae bacterium]|jgi:hypothetical protein